MLYAGDSNQLRKSPLTPSQLTAPTGFPCLAFGSLVQ